MASVYSRKLSWIAEQTRIPETPTEGARVPFIASRIGSCHLGFYRTGNIICVVCWGCQFSQFKQSVGVFVLFGIKLLMMMVRLQVGGGFPGNFFC